MRIAVTGATSMTGIALTKHALEEGHDVIAVVRPGSTGTKDIPSGNVTVRDCEISSYRELDGLDNCDLFFHLAWEKASVAGRDDKDTQLKNAEYTSDAARLAKSWNASAFIGVGSQAEYGPLSGKANIDTPTNPTSWYGKAKLSAGTASAILCEELGMRSCWARLFSSYGEYDRDHTLIMYLIRTLLKGESPELTKCEQMWDYIYSGDVARALLVIGLRGRNGKTYNIGGGKCRPLKEFIIGVRDMIDKNIELKFGVKDYYPHQQMFLCADIDELTSDTGFKPKYTFKEGIARTVSFVRGQSNSISRSD